MNQAQAIALYQPVLHQIAYNLLRCKEDAEDIVQDTFVKWLSIDHDKIKNTKAYLIKSVTNNCLSHLNTLKKKREEYWDTFTHLEIVEKIKETDLPHFDLEKELSAAFKVIQSKLEPLERAALLLREVFDFDYQEIQTVLDKKADHCRQLLSRARKKLEGHRMAKSEMSATPQLFESFKKACHLEDANEFIQHMKADLGITQRRKK